MLKKFSLVILFSILFITGCTNKVKVINSIEDLSSSNIGVYTGSEYDIILSKKISDAKPKYYNSYSDQISALKSGKIDGFLSDEPLAKEIINNNKNLKILKKITNDSYAYAINPKKNDLKKQIDEQLKKMKDNGILSSFEEKWMGSDEEKKVLGNYKYDPINGIIQYATVSGSAPFAYMKDNKIVGYDIDVMMYICKELGYKLEIIEMSFDGIIPALKSGKVDISGCSIIVTEERKKSVIFSEPNYTGGIVIVTRK